MTRGAVRTAVRDHAWSVALVLAAFVVTVAILTQVTTPQADTAASQPAAVTGTSPATPTPDTDLSPQTVTAADVACRDNTVPRLVKVSLIEQHMWLCQFGLPVTDTPVTTGSVDRGNGTPTGTWHVESRETDRYLAGPDYRVFVHYWMPFFDDFGFHDSPWQQFAYGDRRQYRTDGSRGCIHVPPAAMATLYTWAQVGTSVTIT